MKLCKDCLYYAGPGAVDECIAPENAEDTGTADYVNGGKLPPSYLWHSAQRCRSQYKYCGPDAKWFKAKEPA